MTIGDRIRELRKNHLNLNQTEFGSKIGLTQAAVGGYEKNIRGVSEQSIKSICREYGVNEEWLRTGKGDVFAPKTKNELITEFLGELIVGEDNFKKKLIETLAQLEEDDWAVLEKLAQRLTEKEE